MTRDVNLVNSSGDISSANPSFVDIDMGDRHFSGLDDGLVGALRVMEYEHHEIHEGKFFVGSIISTALTSGTVLSFAANPIPTGTFAHFRFNVNAGGAAKIQLLEDSTLSGGVATSLVNANRNASSATFKALANPTIDGGDVLVEYTIGGEGGRQGQTGAGAGGLVEEFITKDNETYVITLENESSLPYPASINVGFYPTTVGTT